MMRFSLVICLVFLVNETCSLRILGVFTFAGKSHYNLGGALMKGLAEAGHDVTVVTVFHDKEVPKNGTWREIFLEGSSEKQFDLFGDKMSPKNMPRSFLDKLAFMQIVFNSMAATVTELILAEPKMQDLIRSNEKFDVVIIPQFIFEAMKGLATHFNAHLVLLNNLPINFWINHLVGKPTLPSFFPDHILGYPEKMTFMQRVKNAISKYLQLLVYNFVVYPKHRELAHRYISKDVDLYDSLYNVSLVLSNGHESLNYPQPSVPCIKDIGGFHVVPPKKLPEYLQKYLDNAEDGAIFFSLGSNVRSVDVPIATRDALLQAFAKRKERILVKWDDDVMPGKPSNVLISKWFPQSDVLAHPNLRLFITHGGFLSITESVYHGVPVVVFPIFADQQMNARSAENIGFAMVLDILNLTEEAMSATLEEILSNPKYTESVKRRSRIFHDRPRPPLEEAIYWIEYVVRHNGADHLKVSYVQMPWYRYILLDVLAFMFIVLLIFLVSLRFISKLVFRFITGKPRVKKE